VAERPILAITMGDPAGIGPEVVVKGLADPAARTAARPLVVGAVEALAAAARISKLPWRFRPIASVAEARFEEGTLDVLDPHPFDYGGLRLGALSATGGAASMAYVAKAAELALSGQVAAIVNAPINKEAIKLAGYQEAGHMEFLARLAGVREHATMLVSKQLRVVHLTTHVSLAQACTMVTRERVLARLRLTQRSFQGWGYDRPRLAVAGLNPHNGDGGLFGREEIDTIAPAVEAARAEGIDVSGPIPADSVFVKAMRGAYDAVLAMYHDQGHIAIKVHGFEESISVALGLPFIRTSVDHGTAFDIAGQGVADARSMVQAVVVAAALANRQARSLVTAG